MKFLSPICWFLEKAFFALSQVDGKPGLTKEDFTALIEKIKSVSKALTSTNTDKATIVAAWLSSEKSGVIKTWTAHILTWIAYQYSKRKGLLK